MTPVQYSSAFTSLLDDILAIFTLLQNEQSCDLCFTIDAVCFKLMLIILSHFQQSIFPLGILGAPPPTHHCYLHHFYTRCGGDNWRDDGISRGYQVSKSWSQQDSSLPADLLFLGATKQLLWSRVHCLNISNLAMPLI